MRVALFSDVHAIHHSLFALDRELKQEQVDVYWCLGDVVGYGPYPQAVIDRMKQILKRDERNLLLRGNHDDGVGFWDREEGGRRRALFDLGAKRIIERHARLLDPTDRAWLRDLPLWAAQAGCFLAHGAFATTDEAMLWQYATRDVALARATLERAWGAAQEINEVMRLVAVGHYHVPALLRWDDNGGRLELLNPWENGGLHRFEALSRCPLVLNPGSISLPRDVGERSTASYIVMELEDDCVTLQFRQLAFDYCPVLDDIPPGDPVSDRLRRELKHCALPSGVTCGENDD